MNTLYLTKIAGSPFTFGPNNSVFGYSTPEAATAAATKWPAHSRPTMEVHAATFTQIHAEHPENVLEATALNLVSLLRIATLPGGHN